MTLILRNYNARENWKKGLLKADTVRFQSIQRLIKMSEPESMKEDSEFSISFGIPYHSISGRSNSYSYSYNKYCAKDILEAQGTISLPSVPKSRLRLKSVPRKSTQN